MLYIVHSGQLIKLLSYFKIIFSKLKLSIQNTCRFKKLFAIIATKKKQSENICTKNIFHCFYATFFSPKKKILNYVAIHIHKFKEQKKVK